ncbi:MAG: FixH family protein [Spirochaetota bacterium]
MKKLDSSLKYAFSLIVLLFLALFAATWFTVKVSLQGHEKIVDPNYYEKGLNYEKAIAAKREMHRQGYSLQFPEEKPELRLGKNKIQIQFHKQNQAVAEAKLSVKLARGATYRFDKSYGMQSVGEGLHVSQVEVPASGEWLMTFSAKHGEQMLEKVYRFVVKN